MSSVEYRCIFYPPSLFFSSPAIGPDWLVYTCHVFWTAGDDGHDGSSHSEQTSSISKHKKGRQG